MFKVLLVLAASVYVTVAQDPATTCGALPLRTFDLTQLILDSPFRVVYSMDQTYQCSSVFYTSPYPDNSVYDLGSTYNNDTSVIVNLQLKINQPDNTSDTVTFCTQGPSDTHTFLNMGDVSQSNGYCIFTCDPQGITLTALKCMSRGGTGLTSTDFTNIVNMVKGVPNAPQDTSDFGNCGTASVCSYFQH